MSEATPPGAGGGPGGPGSGSGRPPPPPPEGSSAGAREQAADVGIRIGAKLIDGLLVGIVFFVLFVPFFVGALFTDAATTGAMGLGFSVGGWISTVISSALTVGYFALMENYRGQTLGKMLLNLRVEGAGGGNPTTEEAVRRNLWLALPIIPFVGGLAELAAAIAIAVTISQSSTKQGWHDEFAGGTRVLQTG